MGSASAGAAMSPYSVIEQVASVACWANTACLCASRSKGPLVPCARPTSLIGAAGNEASTAADSEITPVDWEGAIVPECTLNPAGGSTTVVWIAPV